jgi:hypothetical protein
MRPRMNPATKPPICAQKATPVVVSVATLRLMSPNTSWVTNQKAINKTADILVMVINGPIKSSILTVAFGNITR